MPAYASDHETTNIHGRETELADDSSADDGESTDLRSDVLDRLQNVSEQVSEFVQERPLAAIGIAAAAGFLVARLINR